MKFGFSLVVRGDDATPETFARMAARAEALALDSLWCSAHVILPPQVESGYEGVAGRRYDAHWQQRYWEPFAVLSYVAGLTQSVTLGTSVLVLPMHNPFEIAKHVAEVDQLSRGRFVFGIGVGWFKEEFQVLGQPFHNRGARTDEALRLLRSLWSEDPVTFEGRYYRVQDAFFGPKPVQRPHPPIWVAGASPAALRRAARYADAWHPVRPSFEYLAAAKRELDGYVEEAGRAAGSVKIAVKMPMLFDRGTAAMVSAIQRYRDIGASHFVLDSVPETRAVALDTMERFAQEVRPQVE